MSQLPPDLSAAVSPAECETATAWWDRLTATQQCDLTTLFDPRQDECFFGIDPDGDDPPAVRGGRFIPHDDAWGFDEWGPEWFDHLAAHPEIVAVGQTFHICTRHPAARAALAAGLIPADFACPFASDDCPMRRLLNAFGGRGVRLAGLRGSNGTRRVVALPTV